MPVRGTLARRNAPAGPDGVVDDDKREGALRRATTRVPRKGSSGARGDRGDARWRLLRQTSLEAALSRARGPVRMGVDARSRANPPLRSCNAGATGGTLRTIAEHQLADVSGRRKQRVESRRVRLFFVWRPNQSLRRRRGRRQSDPPGRGEERRRVQWPTVLLSSATDGGPRLVLARFVRGLSTHQGFGCPRRLRTAATAAKCHHAPADSHRVADQMPTGPSISRRRAPHAASPAATWMMSSTTEASRAYAAVPARRSRC